ncbi:dUTP diphosphatase [Butyrivibrio sp. WCD3002]|uniref:dUTP diphosphatase n=1 Tax=Butyrivibrio sp. WCD3002 TaxID=1280676 RepID=UPI0003FFB5F7|nr:dUTP diphosphatase [Butyrivibrio sp. WCD3002]
MLVKIKKLDSEATLPGRGSLAAAGYDLYANVKEDTKIAPHTTAKIGTGLAMEIPDGYFGGIYARSGIATKEGLRPANCVGVVDSDYRGEIIVAVHNDSDVERTITPNERVAQIIIQPYLEVEFEVVDELRESERGAGGFGSTGKQ